jgi:hypothetical protein
MCGYFQDTVGNDGPKNKLVEMCCSNLNLNLPPVSQAFLSTLETEVHKINDYF